MVLSTPFFLFKITLVWPIVHMYVIFIELC